MDIIIGILAGMGPKSTSPFLDSIINYCQELYGAKWDIEFPRILIYSLPTPFHPQKKTNPTEMKESLFSGIDSLIKGGVDYIAVPCNTVHEYYDFMSKTSTVPVLNMINDTVEAIPKNTKTVCLLATRSTIESQLYQKLLTEFNTEILHNDEVQDAIDEILCTLKVSGYNDEVKNKWNKIISICTKNNTKSVIIACTDLSPCITENDNKKMCFINSADVLAKKVVLYYCKRMGKKLLPNQQNNIGSV